ncbi:hypothetical protein TVAG_411890 [Trichomonas vaginalis G3]|uniref:Uncharacterized protein n=1 Tax=Trichomonas vaginalis (strain ATCC PRA-98 / G3) TaxID=412133 RepID=A2FB97_TRIV3|nr:armadillo (ARM) repeat-containing protein family [Trichomonas vaginalis G3]EAX97827.1 hypothetical protein TVAG_411890 [Trichomonas vaginalis G3]KAI5490367.1 armadillo (ARM) repeat-containing protein family [Trichomonas vaginalis G3]|eukprot:XP_001310757.1 hypothetical protein [Trichomonas vaginalis G3]
MNIEELLLVSFRGNNEEVFEAQNQLLSLPLNESVLISFLNIISNTKNDELLRTAAVIRIKQILFDNIQLIFQDSISNILKQWIVDIFQTKIYELIPSILEISRIVVQKLFFTENWPDFPQISLPSIALVWSLLSYFKFNTDPQLDPSFITDFLQIYTQSINELSITDKTLLFRCASYISILNLPEFFQYDHNSLSLWISQIDSIIHNENIEDEDFVHFAFKFYSQIVDYEDFVSFEEVFKILNKAIEVTRLTNNAILLHYSFSLIKRCLKRSDIFQHISMEEIITQFILPSFEFTEYDFNLAEYYPKEFALSNFVFDSEIYDRKNLAAYLSFSLCKYPGYADLLFNIAQQNMSLDNIIIYLQGIITVINKINKEIVSQFINQTFELCLSEDPLIKSCYFALLTHIHGIELDSSIICACLESINDEHIYTGFYALSAFCSLLQESSEETVKMIVENYKDNIEGILEIFLNNLSMFGSNIMLRNSNTLIRAFNEYIIPYLEEFCCGVNQMLPDLLLNVKEDFYMIDYAMEDFKDFINSINAFIDDNSLIYIDFISSIMSIYDEFDDEYSAKGCLIDFIELLISKISTFSNDIFEIIHPIFNIDDEFNMESIVCLCRTLLIRMKEINDFYSELIDFVFNVAAKFESKNEDIAIDCLYSLIMTTRNEDIYNYILNNLGKWEANDKIYDLISSLIICNPTAIYQMLYEMINQKIEFLQSAAILKLLPIIDSEDIKLNYLIIITENIKQDVKNSNVDSIDFEENKLENICKELHGILSNLKMNNSTLFDKYNEATFPFMEETLQKYI